MSLPAAAPQRQLKHRRQLDVQVFSRNDGLWEVDTTLTDTETRAAPLAIGIRPAGLPIHEMQLRLVINESLDILEAGSETRRMPYGGVCNEHGDAYGRLAGLTYPRWHRPTSRAPSTRSAPPISNED